MENGQLTEKEIRELGEKYSDLLRELSYQLMQTSQVLKMPHSMPEEEKKHMQDLSECATNILFTASLRNPTNLIDINHILQSAFLVTEHHNDIKDIALKYAPENPYKVKPAKCSHTFTGRGREYYKVLESLGRLSPMIEELRQYDIKDKFHKFRKYHDKTRSV